MGGLFRGDGTVSMTSLGEAAEWLKDRQMPVLMGIILSVKPSDSEENYSGQNHDDGRGYRHECTVLASDYLGKQPDILIPNCIIPPSRHSGIDNFEEDLPYGCSEMIDGTEYKDSFEGIDYTKIDGEWCLVSFIGGNIENPFIVGWWPHPQNVFDPATIGDGNDGKALVQVDTNKNRSRFVRRINGTVVLVNKQGSLYLDTSESNSTIQVKDGKVTRTLVEKGGHIQVDLCKKAQLEWNFNEKEHKNKRIGAGSTTTTAVTDEDLLHNDQPVSGSVKTRETKRSYTRWSEFDALLKSSGVTIYCEDTSSETDGNEGNFTVLAESAVAISQQASGGTAATVSIKDGKIQVVAADGSQINVLSDEIQIVNKTGSFVSVKDAVVNVAATTISLGGSVGISGALSVGLPTAEPVLLGTTVLKDFGQWLADIALAGATWASTVPPTPVSNGAFIATFVAKTALLVPKLLLWAAKNMKTS